jgi:ABC-type transport system involved in Fe-S cluster assembly fused permease/ATPase subunit
MMSRAGVSAIQSYLWMPIDQYTHRSLTTAAYNHVMSLSYDFHTSRNTGEIWSSINQGRSVSGFIDTFLFQVGPMVIDLCVAFAYFYILFDMYMALIVAVVSVSFLYVTAKLSARKNALRRELNHNARNEVGILVETISSWTTVNYFNRVPYEQTRYDRAVGLYQAAERKWTIGITVLGASQSLVFTLGLLAASFLAVYQVSRGVRPVGSFVTLLSYWAQLSIPLSFFADFLRRIQNQLLDSERLLELFETVPAMKDEPDAIDLDTTKGEIEFENVSFSYDVRKPAISDMSFRVAPGTTVAFVGETGGGKTTCLKLFYRFYDVKSGSIKVDGHDIRGIKLDSFRKHIGVVPQDPQLFNDTIINNLKYANFDATDEEIHAACRAASIHDKIMSFPDGYLSKVGERGIKLSGGELQRVSIARAMLKNPRIILLDEATSMIDMETEQHIQEAFQQLAKDRTMFIVAHRLSTIMNADMILVIKEGRIIERGSHEELLDIQGKYYRMWSRQSKPADPKPAESKKSLLIEDLFSMSAKDEAYESEAMHSQGSRRLQIPESSNSVRRQSGPFTVTFSLPEQRAYWNFGYRQPPTNPRLAIPNHGILKNTSHPQVPNGSARNVGVSMKSLFQLKPDAKEFVPRRLSVTEQNPAPEVGSNDSSQPQKAEEEVVSPNDDNQQTTTEAGSEPEPIGTESSTNDTALKTLAVQENAQLDEKYAVLDVIRSSSTSIATTIIPESSGEGATDVDPVSDAPAGTRRRRRRVRRRSSRKLGTSASSDETLEADQSSPSDGAERDVPDAVVADPVPTKVQRSEGENVEILNGNASKTKRRFRNGSKSKNQGTEPATEEPSTVTALSSLAPVNGAVVEVRSRSESIGQNGTKPVKAPASMENKRPTPSANAPSDLSQRKASINGQVQEQKSGAPRKAQKAPLGGGPGNSTSEA